MQELQFENVWYRPDESSWRNFELAAYKDSGRLVVRADSLEFYGKSGRLIISGARSVALAKQGRDFINDWVRVDYGDPAAPATASSPTAVGSAGAASSAARAASTRPCAASRSDRA